MLDVWVAVIDDGPPYPDQLCIKRLQATKDEWELTFARDGRAVFRYGEQRRPRMRNIVWLRVGTHDVLP